VTGFSTWQPLALAVAPTGPGVLQIRAGIGNQGLQRYPNGQSAMVLYDADDQDLHAALSRARLILAHVAARTFSVRFLPTRHAREDLARLLREFELRFGAPPSLSGATP